jgi:hypothetical protein
MNKEAVIVRKKEDPKLSETWRRIEELLLTVRYGSITLLIQDGKVSQIDKTEKFRLNNHS